MIIVIAIMALALIIITIKYIMYRRQIGDICRQLSFVLNNETNLGFTSSVDAKEILELEKLINKLNDNAKNDRIAYKRQDRQLK